MCIRDRCRTHRQAQQAREARIRRWIRRPVLMQKVLHFAQEEHVLTPLRTSHTHQEARRVREAARQTVCPRHSQRVRLVYKSTPPTFIHTHYIKHPQKMDHILLLDDTGPEPAGNGVRLWRLRQNVPHVPLGQRLHPYTIRTSLAQPAYELLFYLVACLTDEEAFSAVQRWTGQKGSVNT